MAEFICVLTSVLLVFATLTQGSQIGDRCSEDKECDSYTNNLFVCKMQQSCDCKNGYHPLPSRDACQAAIGTACKTQDDCVSLAYSECNQGSCMCRTDYIAKYDNLECLPRTNFIGDSCKETPQCQLSFGDQSMCEAERCRCLSGYHISGDQKCIKDVGLSGSCSRDDDCYIENSVQNVLSCQSGQCNCKDGFVLDENMRECVSSGNILAASILTLAAWGIARLLA